LKGRELITWEQIRQKYDSNEIDKARTEYWGQEAIKDLQENEATKELIMWGDVGEYLESKADYIQLARNSAITSFAIIVDGVWHERGEMGWWGCVHDEKDRDIWDKEFAKMLDELPDDALLSVYDCHI
jgi:hypothetical protein